MKSVSYCLKVTKSLNLLSDVSRGFLAGLLGVELLTDGILNLVKLCYAFLVDSGDSCDKQVVVVDSDDLGNLADLVLECPT